MIADDSPFMRMILKDIIDQQSDMELVAACKRWLGSGRTGDKI